MTIYFVTTNEYKVAEARKYCDWFGSEHNILVDLRIVESDVQEILHRDIEIVVRQKALKAYEHFGRPCVVEHGGLFMDALPGLPGGLGKIVWEAVGDRLCGFLRPDDTRAATARSIIGYCDGKTIRLFHGEARGNIAERSRGGYAFQWDTIFIPEGCDETYGEMGQDKKLAIGLPSRAPTAFTEAWRLFLTAALITGTPADLMRSR